MADNVIVRVPEQQFIRGEDGYSPEVTIEDITHGHRVTITDEDHPTGQSFNVMDGDSAYEQAVAGGYEGTETQFNEDLANFKFLSYAATSAASEANTSAQSANRSELRARSSERAAEDAAAAALIRMNSAATSAQAAEDASSFFTSTILPNAVNTINSTRDQAVADVNVAKSTAVQNVQTEGATQITAVQTESATQQAAVQQKGDDVLESIPSDYTELSEDVDGLEQTTTATTIGPVALASFDASAANMPLKGLTVNIEPVQSGSGDPSPDNVRPITGLTGCKLHHTGVSLIGGEAFIGYAFAKNGEKYELSYNGSGIANRASGYADISGIPAGRYVLEFLNCSYPEGIEVTFRRRTNGTLVTIGTIIGGATSGARAFDIPANTTELQFYIVPNSTVEVGDKVTMDDAILYRNGETAEPYKGNTYNITFPSEAGTVYGGTLDVVNKKLTVDKIAYIATGTGSSAAAGMRFYKSSNTSRNEFYTLNSNNGIVVPSQTSTDKVICSHFKAAAPSNSAISCFVGSSQFRVVFPRGGDIETTTQMNNWVAEQYANGTPLTYVLTLATPIVYDLSDIPDVLTIGGENNIWANCGDVTVTYGAYLEAVKAYADQVGDSILSAIAPLETSYTASRAYTVGSFLFVGTKFYKVTAAISSGDTITPDTNVTQTTVAEQLIALANV